MKRSTEEPVHDPTRWYEPWHVISNNVDSDEPVQPHFKLRISKWCSVSSLTVIEYSSNKQRLWSDYAYAQADLRFCWSHTTLLEISCCGSYVHPGQSIFPFWSVLAVPREKPQVLPSQRWAQNENSDLTGFMSRLVWVFAEQYSKWFNSIHWIFFYIVVETVIFYLLYHMTWHLGVTKYH